MTDAGADTFEVLGRRPRGLASLVIFAALLVVAGAVLFPVLATALNGFKNLGEIAHESARAAARLDVEATTGASSPATDTGRCSAIRC